MPMGAPVPLYLYKISCLVGVCLFLGLYFYANHLTSTRFVQKLYFFSWTWSISALSTLTTKGGSPWYCSWHTSSERCTSLFYISTLLYHIHHTDIWYVNYHISYFTYNIPNIVYIIWYIKYHMFYTLNTIYA